MYMIIKETKPAEQLLHQFCDGYKRRDLPFLLNLFSEEATIWGTGIDEYRSGLNEIEMQFHRDWSQSDKGEIQIQHAIPTTANVLWVAAVCLAQITIEGTTHSFEHLRGTLIVEQINGVWKIVHMHCSFPDYRNAENGSFPVN